MMGLTRSQSSLLFLSPLLAVSLLTPEAALGQIAPKVFYACYVPATGTVYRIKEPGIRQNCAAPQHVQFSWIDGLPDHDHGNLNGLADDDHPQYVREGEAAGGDLGGTYPNPTVSAFQGRSLASTAPSDGQVLTWNEAVSQWEPKTAPSGASDHGGLSGLTDDDHPQYVLVDGVRTATTGFAVTGTLGAGTIPATGAGVRLMWYPRKAAFRAGEVHGPHWDDVNVGSHSTALGFNPVASGNFSTALGIGTSAVGNFSTALGNTTTASGINSTAMGVGSTASGNNSTAMGNTARATGLTSTAMGSSTTASGFASIAMGSNTTASGDNSTAIGMQTNASGLRSTAMGINTSASGDAATAMGSTTTASGAGSTAMGANTTAGGNQSTAVGLNTTASGNQATAMGGSTIASGSRSTAMGSGTTASGGNSTAMGLNTTASGGQSTATGAGTTASGGNSTAMGLSTTASGPNSTAMGDGTTASGLDATAIGDHTTAQARGSLAIGRFNVVAGSPIFEVSTDPLLVAGNGTPAAPSNALTLYKNGNLTIAGTLTQASDIRLKEAIEPLDGVLARVLQLTPIRYRFREGTGHPADRKVGLSAQAVEPLFPELVRRGADGYLSLAYADLSAVLVRAIQEQQRQIDALGGELTALRDQTEALKAEIAEVLRRHAGLNVEIRP